MEEAMADSPYHTCKEANLEKLKVRVSSLLAADTKEAAEETHSLNKVWPGGQPPLVASSQEEETVWQQCLVAFGLCKSWKLITANHFLNVIEVGCDTNRVLYPHKILRAGSRKMTPWSDSVDAIDGNDRDFVLTDKADRSKWSGEVEQEAGHRWQMDLAKSASDLRASAHEDDTAFDTILVPWPLFPLNLLTVDDDAQQEATDAQLFGDNQYLRAHVHKDSRELDCSFENWRSMPENVIPDDLCTDAQLKILEARGKRGPLSASALARRRDGVNPRFFEEIQPTLEKEAALAEMRSRWAKDKATAAREHDLAAEYGAQFVAWPVENELRWPNLPRVWVQHARWFEMWRRSQQKAKKQSKELSCASSEASWEALSECSDSSWQAVSEVSTTSWLELVTEAGVVDKSVDVFEMLQRLRANQHNLDDSAPAPSNSMDALSEEDISKLKLELERVKDDCETELAAAMASATPALESAAEGLSKLSKGDVGEVRAMNSPPNGVVLTAQALCIMFAVKPVKLKPIQNLRSPGYLHSEPSPAMKKHKYCYWQAAKEKLLADPRLLERMLAFDKDNISDAVMAKIQPLFKNPEFEPDTIKKASKAAAGICMWVRAMVAYNGIVKQVQPKKLKLAAAVKAVADAATALAKKQGRCDDFVEVSEVSAKGADDASEVAKLKAQTEALEAAKSACDCLTKAAIQELKCLGKPPAGIDDVCAVVAFLLRRQKKKIDWKGAQAMMGDPSAFLKEVLAFDATNIPDDVLKLCEPIIRLPFFNFDAMKAKSSAAAHLAAWVINVIAYNRIYKSVGSAKTQGETKSSAEAKDPAEETKRCAKADAAMKRGACISKGDIVELKSLSKPPVLVVKTLLAVFTLTGQEPSDWAEAKALLGDVTCLSNLLRFDADAAPINPATLKKLEPYMADPDFRPEHVRKSSAAAGGLCRWVREKYDKALLTTDNTDVASTASPTSPSAHNDLSDFSVVSSPASVSPATLLMGEES
jgi:hypothetical protein